MKMTGQTRVIVFTAMALAAVDIAVRLHQPRPVVLDSPSATNVVTAQEFRLVDRDGNTRIVMSIDDNNEPGIRLLDRNGQVRAQLDTWQSTPSLILNGPDGSRRVYFGMDGQGGGMLDMMNEDGSDLLTMDATDNMPNLRLHDVNGATRGTFSVDGDGHANLFMMNENGFTGADTSGSTSLSYFSGSSNGQ